MGEFTQDISETVGCSSETVATERPYRSLARSEEEPEGSVFTAAKWIWCADSETHGYNLAAHFSKEFEVSSPAGAILRITADSRYRVFVNGVWINDGPGKAYPEHFQYDLYKLDDLLVCGINRIEVIVRYYGVGTFHQIPQRAGLLAEIEVDGKISGSDRSWLAGPYDPLFRWVPKASCQMEPCEWFDARKDNPVAGRPAVEVSGAQEGPWRDLGMRRSRPITKSRRKPVSVYGMWTLSAAPCSVCVPVTRIAHPGVIETNHLTSRPVVLAATMTLEKPVEANFDSPDWIVAMDGRRLGKEPVSLEAGNHTFLFFCSNFYGHQKELAFPFFHLPGVEWKNWACFVRDEFLFRDTDIVWLNFPNEKADQARRGWFEWVDRIVSRWFELKTFPAGGELGCRRELSGEQLFMADFTDNFAHRRPDLNSPARVGNATGVCRNGSGIVRVDPVDSHDVEICYDFGEQCCGYFEFEIEAPEGVAVDLHMVEYITPEGRIQHTAEFNRNGMRFVTRAGTNTHTSLKRRSGRFLFVTLRNLREPVEIRRMAMVEFAADLEPVQRFRCNDEDLNLIWDACERTIKMGMEDTFTDCSLYEQTLWIGDARNQALYAFNIYGAYSTSARSLEIGAQSLERFPIVGCQVPSTWECILPAWSFLWGIWVWEHYFYSGDVSFLQKIWPAVLKNLEGAFQFMDANGLFSGTFWNLFEWAPIDDAHPTVMHNNMLLVGAIRAAERCADVLGDRSASGWLQTRRQGLIDAINVWWDVEKKCYPDAILDDGSASPKCCQHNSALAILFDVLPKEYLPEAHGHLTGPFPGMTRINSPFAAQFHFEALEKLGEIDAILDCIRENYIPMIRAGATTVWETFPNSTCSPPGFPTRSHCHGWSCGPLQFFNRILLGITQREPGGTEFEISPWVAQGINRASGAMATPSGPVNIGWSAEQGRLNISIDTPHGVIVRYCPNRTHTDLIVHQQIRVHQAPDDC